MATEPQSNVIVANGAADVVKNVTWGGGRGVLLISGIGATAFVAGSGAITLSWSVDGINYFTADVLGTSLAGKNAAGQTLFELPPCKIQFKLAGSTGTTRLTAAIAPLHTKIT